ncbi:hypothetical protein H6F90_10685 [Trichocoleus sp. FACHB-591]|uniref:hypothetical protein n=1 Tax=Trichocoleus sp. FACHB-591 TaxID=2692872 RepID=UPI0016821A41|nr:hypothetical protein [Trichocoleus sp. FACHB-591]MBD2095620.1 hypothetical protein [Trichocoleus sp. FACHB-591]
MSVPEYPSISKQNPVFPEYLDFEKLRAIGIAHLQQMSGKLWTDYNLHDPGVTILEVLCYAVTELGYRNNLDIQDLLAKAPAQVSQEEDNFFTPDQILTCNPVTELDLRKCLLNIKGVRNAWIKPYENYHLVFSPQKQWEVRLEPPPQGTDGEKPQALPEAEGAQNSQSGPWLQGLYTVLLDLEPPIYFDACGQPYQPLSGILNEVKAALNRYRNLCEDFHELIVLGEEAIALRGEIELDSSIDANDVLVEIFIQVQGFLAPSIQFHSLQELLDRGKNPAEIFAGRPAAIAHHDAHDARQNTENHGFIDTEELEDLTLPTQIHTSDLYRIILDVPGVKAVKKLSIQSYINGLAQSPEQSWSLNLAVNFRPVLELEQYNLALLKGGLPAPIDQEKVKRHYQQKKFASLKAYRNESDLDLSIPHGTHYPDLATHYSIHHDFPLTYGISEDGLPETASSLRKAQAKQLKGYLVFFDQMLANYLKQLSHVRDLFSWKEQISWKGQNDGNRTSFTQVLDFPGAEKILALAELPNDETSAESFKLPEDWDEQTRQPFLAFLEEKIEDENTALERRNRFLDHILARFAESFTDYVLLNYRLNGGLSNADSITRVIQDKAKFLQDYPQLSRDRFRAANVSCQNTQHRCYTSGLEQRIARLLGIKTGSTEQTLVRYNVAYQPGHFRICLGWDGRRDRDSDRPLLVRQTYPTLEAAQNALTQILECIRNSSRFQRLIYRSAYYGWEVIDNDCTSLALYDHSYPTDIARNAALTPLVQQIRQVMFDQLRDRLSPDLRSNESISAYLQALQSKLLINLDATPQNTLLVYRFLEPGDSTSLELEALPMLPSEDIEKVWTSAIRPLLDDIIELNGTAQDIGFLLKLSPIGPQFRSAQRYKYRDAAQDAAVKTLGQILFKSFYHPISIALNDVEPTVLIDGKLTTYGFAVVDDQVAILADMDSALGFGSARERDEKIEDLQDTTSLNIAIQQVAPSYIGELRLDNGKTLPLQEIHRFTAELAGLFCFGETGQTIDSDSPSETTTWHLAGVEWDALQASIQDHLMRSDRVINLEIVQVNVGNEQGKRTSGYRFCCVPSHPSKAQPWQFNSLALYPTAREARAWGNRALERLRSAKFPLSEEKPVRPLQRQWGEEVRFTLIILDAEPAQWAEDNAWEHGSMLIRLVESDDSIRLIDPQEPFNSTPQGTQTGDHTFALSGMDQRSTLARYPTVFKSASERSQAIQVLRDSINGEGLYAIEHILLRPRQTDMFQTYNGLSMLPIPMMPRRGDEQETTAAFPLPLDPYSFWVSVILPAWPRRFQDRSFRQFVESTLRAEAPAHVALKIAWVSLRSMQRFEQAYRAWINQLSLMNCEDQDCGQAQARNDLLQVLSELQSVYPVATLDGPATPGLIQNPIILNQTPLGSMYE